MRPPVERLHAELHAQARKTGKKECPKGLIRDGWHLMLTNLGKEQVSITKLGTIYSARWAVEVQFRAWKQALNLPKTLSRKDNEDHMPGLVLPAMIAN
jgi:IS4 transposase